MDRAAKTDDPRQSDRDQLWLVMICSCASIIALYVYWSRGDVLLYGDAVAHIGIARRVVDSLTPGMRQFGTVWLPLPHLLMIPFVARLDWWRTGVAASIPSMAAYVFGAVGLFRLVRRGLGWVGIAQPVARASAWLAAFAFAANPNLLYLQTTAMTEPLYLALIIWALVYFCEFAKATLTRDVGFLNSTRSVRGPLMRSGVLVAAAEMTRYDGWFAAAVFCFAALVIFIASVRRSREFAASLLLFFVIVAAAPSFWLAYNTEVYGNPLEFANGPYSARAIEERALLRGGTLHPGAGDPGAALVQYGRAVALTLGEKRWGPTIFWAAVAGALLFIIQAFRRRTVSGEGAKLPTVALVVWMILWAPLPFYVLSLAFGSVPIFLPMWWPYSYYNTRYGLQLLPAIAVSVAVLTGLIAQLVARQATRRLVFALAATFIACAYLSCWVQNPARTKDPLPGEPYRGPIVWREALVNAATRVPYEQKLATALEGLPPSSRLLMFTGEHIGALQRAGIPLRSVVNENNGSLWRLALMAPADAADFVVTTQDDPVADAVQRHPQGLRTVATIDSPGQPHTVIYRSH
jgi:hypothetical protein